MSTPALQWPGPMPRWSGWAVTGAVHVAIVLALASAFAPLRPKAPAPMTISARLVAPAALAAAPMTPMTPVPIALPRSALTAPPMPDIPPPIVQIASVPPVAVAATPLRFDAPSVAAIDADAAPSPRPVAVAAVNAAAPAPPVAPAMPAPVDTPAALPADHRLCSARQTERHYPALLRERGIQGLVTLRVKVDADGRAAEVVVAGGSGWRLLDEAARRVAESCPYVPARRGDQRLISWVEYPVRFALQPSHLQ